MILASPNEQMIRTIMTWVGSEQELRVWAGPSVGYPFTLSSLTHDLNLEVVDSYCLLDTKSTHDDHLLAFGQFYVRLSRCHLSRLIVAPTHRGQGVVRKLIEELTIEAKRRFSLDGDSLFVAPSNKSAMKVYSSLGFNVAEYPEKSPLSDHIYMTRA